MAKKSNDNKKVERTAKNLETRKKFFDDFSKKFEVKKNKATYVWAAADDGTWKEPFCYVHIFQKDAKHQLFYYLMSESGKSITWKMSREVGKLIEEANYPVVVRRREIIKEVIKKDPKTGEKIHTGEKRHTQTCLITKADNIPELVKFAKAIVAAAQAVAETAQEEKTAK